MERRKQNYYKSIKMLLLIQLRKTYANKVQVENLPLNIFVTSITMGKCLYLYRIDQLILEEVINTVDSFVIKFLNCRRFILQKKISSIIFSIKWIQLYLRIRQELDV